MADLDADGKDDLENLEDSKYIGLAIEACTKDNPLGGLHVYTDETSSDITSELHENATVLKSTILNARNFDELKSAFKAVSKTELKETIDYVGSPIIDFLYTNLIIGFVENDVPDTPVKKTTSESIKKTTSENINMLFCAACRQTDSIHLLKFIICRGLDITHKHTLNYNLLNAINNERVNIVKFLLDNGADSNEGVSFYGQPLVVAAKVGNLPIVKLLVKKSANVNARAGHALVEAARKGHVSIFKHLIESGAKIRTDDDYYIDFNALMSAVESYKDSLPIVEYIIENNLVPIHFISRALAHAADNNHLDIVKYIVRKCNVSHQSKIAVYYRGKYSLNQEMIDFIKTEGGVTDLDIEQNPNYHALRY